VEELLEGALDPAVRFFRTDAQAFGEQVAVALRSMGANGLGWRIGLRE